MAEDLEIVLQKKVRPLIDEATTKYLGVPIDRLGSDLTSKLERTALLDIHVDTTLSFKEAKKKFKKEFIKKLLALHLGNISEAAKAAGTDRRSIHRLIKELSIDVKQIKFDLIKPYEIKLDTVSHIIEDVLAEYKTVLHPDKLKDLYENVSTMSEEIVQELPMQPMTLKEAEHEFEKAYLFKALQAYSFNLSETAKAIKIRYETLIRKMKKYDL